MIKGFLTILVLGLIPLIPANVPEKEDKCMASNDTFIDGETLVYKLYYNWKLVWIPAGEVKFTVREGKEYYEYFAEGKTYSSYDNFFKVRDYYYSKVNKSTLYPENFVRDIEEGKYFRYDSIVFNQEDQKAISYWGSQPENAKPYEYELDGCMQDMLSILYYVRNYDFSGMKKGEKVPISVFFDKETYPLKVQYDGKDKKKKIKNLGKFKTLKFIPEVVAGYVFDEDTRMKLWVSDDENRIPLLIESPVSIGSIKAVLKRHENLKYPLTSQISD
jgi:hypothetical protein